MSDVTQILLNAQCGDDATMKTAESQLEQARVGNLPTYMVRRTGQGGFGKKG